MTWAKKFSADLVLWIGVTALAFALRYEAAWGNDGLEMLVFVLCTVPIKILGIAAFGLYSQGWRTIGVRDLEQLLRAVALVTMLELFLAWNLASFNVTVPLSVPLISAMLAVMVLGGIRLSVRLRYERKGLIRAEHTRSVLIVGAGAAGSAIAREMFRRPHSRRRPMGFLDDDPSTHKTTLLGFKVFGGIEKLPDIVRQKHVDEVIIAMPSVSGKTLARIVELARKANVPVRTLPGVYELLNDKVLIDQIRDVDINDLLRRQPVQLDLAEITHYIGGKTVLVTGAGGSIGSEIVRQVAQFAPSKIVMLGRGENSLYHIEQEMARKHPEIARLTVLCDVRHRDRLAHIFDTHRPQVVFHAAAHKHVPMIEQNPEEAVFNNIGGTQNVVDMCLRFEVGRLVNISTDKAVNPTSVMGASKRISEYIVKFASVRAAANQVFVSVRFGNVLGSRGSVVPLFKQQIARGGPITITHAEMKRYFMTIPEAAQLVLAAGGFNVTGAVYVLDMGEPVKIVDLAREMIQLSGLTPAADIDIVFTGMRPGEKMFEELLTAEEGTTASKHEKIFVATGITPPETFPALLDRLRVAADTNDAHTIRKTLRRLIETFKHESLPSSASFSSVTNVIPMMARQALDALDSTPAPPPA